MLDVLDDCRSCAAALAVVRKLLNKSLNVVLAELAILVARSGLLCSVSSAFSVVGLTGDGVMVGAGVFDMCSFPLGVAVILLSHIVDVRLNVLFCKHPLVIV